jgi:hypothetical protein
MFQNNILPPSSRQNWRNDWLHIVEWEEIYGSWRIDRNGQLEPWIEKEG